MSQSPPPFRSARYGPGLSHVPPCPVEMATIARLTWRYGTERTTEIISGRDPETNADLAAWRSLGQSKGRVA